MARHNFTLDGGEELTTLGASWFVSYSYFCQKDKTHFNWKNILTYQNRISVFNRSLKYHKYWLENIQNMSDNNLNRNMIGLEAKRIKEMAKELLIMIT